MYARVATFENREPRRAEELAGLVRSRADELPGAERHVTLVDRRNRTALEITFFDTEQSARAAEPGLERLEREIPELERGRRTSARVYEVAFDEIEDDPGAARACFVSGPSYHVRDGVHAVQDQIAGEAAELDGWRGLVSLADPDSGDAIAITFWATDDALRRSEIRETQLRGRVAAAARGSVTTVERFDDVVSAIPAVA
jgi:hypothetical protein